MSGLDVRVRKHKGGHYFTVFDGVTPLVSGEVKGREITYGAPMPDEIASEVSAAVLAKCDAVDAEIGAWEARKAKKAAEMHPPVKRPAPIAHADVDAEEAARPRSTKKGGK